MWYTAVQVYTSPYWKGHRLVAVVEAPSLGHFQRPYSFKKIV